MMRLLAAPRSTSAPRASEIQITSGAFVPFGISTANCFRFHRLAESGARSS